jgi:ataxin-3
MLIALAGYSVFAVRAADETPHFQLPRTEADELAATLPAPSGASRTASRFGMQLGSLGASSGVSTPGLPSGARTPSSVIANAGPDAAPLGETNADWMADEDMELQAALQASMMSGAGGGFDPAWLDEGSASTGPTAGPAHVPEALTPPAAPRLLSAQLDQDQPDAHLPPTRNRYAAPGAFPIQEDDDEPENEVGNETFQEIFTAEREARELEAAGDAVGAGMARSRAALARFQREQTAAARAMDRFRELREVNETPAAKEARERRQREAEEEDEHMKRAIEESMRMAKDMPMEGVEGQTPLATPTATGSGAGASGPLAHLRTFDDEDAELQAALKASMESAGAHSASSLMPETHPRQRLERGGSHTSVKTQDTYTTESDAGAEDAKMEEAALPPQETMEEIRKKRLARFGA